MSYLSKVKGLRNEMHKGIIIMAIRAAGTSDAELQLEHPVAAQYILQDALYEVSVTGIRCTTGELIAESADGKWKWMYYDDLSLEQLAELHDKVEAKQFQLNLLELC